MPLNFGHKLNSPSKFPDTKKVPENAIAFTSIVKTEKTSILWEIKEISNIKKFNLWTVPNCQFHAGGYLWRLSLHLSDNQNSLLARPELLEPINDSAKYSLSFHVVNPQQCFIYNSPFVCEHPVVAYSIGSTKPNQESNMKWEVLRLNDRPIEQFNNFIFNDALRILVDFTIYKDLHK